MKRELAVWLLLGLPVWLLVERIADSAAGQLGLLALYGSLAAIRVVYRTRRISRQGEGRPETQA